MALASKFFWGIAAVEALFFVAAFLFTSNQSGQNSDGGKEMSLVFFIAIPLLILGVASLIYWKTSSLLVQITLLIAITVPVVLLAARRVQTARWAGEAAEGSWIFEDPAHQALLAAIYHTDSKKVRAMASVVDINAVGQSNWNPLKFAVGNVVDAETKLQETKPRVEMVRLLLSLGAKPAPALEDACRSTHGELVGILLDAGADPNSKNPEGTPSFFSCLESPHPVGVESLRLLGARGAHFDTPDALGKPALVSAAVYSRWDAALFLLDQGVKADAPGPDGKTAASIVEKAIQDQTQYQQPIPKELQLLVLKLKR